MASSPTATPTKAANMPPTVDFRSDEDMERDWKPNGRRPQSTIARSFSAELEGIFRIDDSVAELDAKIDERKQNVQTQASELEALEARIREMEARLKGQGSNPAPQTTIPQRRPVAEINTLSAVDHSQKHGGSRPGTAKASQQAVPGALPPTPTASEGEYEFVPDPYTTSFGPEYPRYRHQHLVPRMTTTSGGDATGAGSGSAQSLRSQHYHQQHYQHQHQYQHQSTFNNNSPTNQHLNFIINKPQPPDARSIKSVRTIGSENGSADFVIVPGPDGDGEQDRH